MRQRPPDVTTRDAKKEGGWPSPQEERDLVR
jgi:hypothetical protein